MLIRILNTLRSRIWDMVFFLFSDYAKSTIDEKGKLNTITTLFVESRKDRQRRINRKQRDEWHKSYDAMGIGYSYNFNNPHKNRYRRTFFG